MSPSTFEIARNHINNKNYAAARQVLEQLGSHPKAREWLKRLDALERQQVYDRAPVEQANSYPYTLPPPPNVFPENRNYASNMYIPEVSGYGLLKVFGYFFIVTGVAIFLFTGVISLLPSLVFANVDVRGMNGIASASPVIFSIFIFIVGAMSSLSTIAFGLMIVAFVELVNNSRAQKALLEHIAGNSL
jgi:hypothetical protein